MRDGTTIAAVAFYLGVAALAAGAIFAARRRIERRGDGRPAIALIVCGLIAITFAVAVFATGPRETLPF